MTSSDPERGDNSAANGQQTCASRSADEAAKRATTEDGQTQTHAQAAVSSSDGTVSPTDRNSDKSEPETASSGMVSCYLTVLLQSYTERETVTAWSAVIRLCLALIDTTRSLAVTDCLSRVVETLKCSHSRSLMMVPFESLDTVSYARSTTTAVSLAVSTQCTNVTDTHPTTTRRHINGAYA